MYVVFLSLGNWVPSHSQIAWPGMVRCCWRSCPNTAGAALRLQESPSWCVFSRCPSRHMWKGDLGGTGEVHSIKRGSQEQHHKTKQRPGDQALQTDFCCQSWGGKSALFAEKKLLQLVVGWKINFDTQQERHKRGKEPEKQEKARRASKDGVRRATLTTNKLHVSFYRDKLENTEASEAPAVRNCAADGQRSSWEQALTIFPTDEIFHEGFSHHVKELLLKDMGAKHLFKGILRLQKRRYAILKLACLGPEAHRFMPPHSFTPQNWFPSVTRMITILLQDYTSVWTQAGALTELFFL